ncbi:MAG: DUF6152 family protein [Gemmatimonadota bacterium]|nr:DUF6152 family protein [Gemmatimonadota bacterium]MDH3422500.1 DUF6152 family protein [Gemmatimonadota bacterium]
MRKTWTTLMMGAVAVLVVALPLVAHHTFGAEFDLEAPVQLEGTVVRLEWVNPHVWIHLEVSRVVQGTTETISADPSEEVWRVEGGSPRGLVVRGLARECLPFGARLIINGFQAKDRTLKRANGRDVTLPDGGRFFLGSSGPDAPRDGAEARANRTGGC